MTDHEIKEKIAYQSNQEFPDFPSQWHWTRACRVWEHFTTPDEDEDILRRNNAEFEKYKDFFSNIAIDGTRINQDTP